VIWGVTPPLPVRVAPWREGLTPKIAHKQFEQAFASGIACTKGVPSQKELVSHPQSFEGSFPRWVFGGKNQRNSWQFIARPKIYQLNNKNNKIKDIEASFILHILIIHSLCSLYSLKAKPKETHRNC
jgi:hypothetical protein